MARTCLKWSQYQVRRTCALVWLPRSLVGDLDHEKLDFSQYLALPFQTPTGPLKHVHNCTFACCQTFTHQSQLFFLCHLAWSYHLKSSWSRCFGSCPVLSQWLEVIIGLVARVFCWILQWTTGRWRTTILQVKYWSLQRKIQPWLMYVFCSYLMCNSCSGDKRRCDCQ